MYVYIIICIHGDTYTYCLSLLLQFHFFFFHSMPYIHVVEILFENFYLFIFLWCCMQVVGYMRVRVLGRVSLRSFCSIIFPRGSSPLYVVRTCDGILQAGSVGFRTVPYHRICYRNFCPEPYCTHRFIQKVLYRVILLKESHESK